ncbi:MAG: VanW family protein [Actinomycetota bacterium]
MGKTLSRAGRLGIIAAAAPIALAAWASVVFALDRASNGSEVLGGISVGGVELSGLSANQARRALQDLEAEMASTPIVFDVQGTRFELLPSALGFDLDDEALLAAALHHGREGGLGEQFRWWLAHLASRGDTSIALAGTWDPETLEPYLEAWEETAIADPPFEGGITVQNNTVIPEAPRPGTGIDRAATAALVDAVMLDLGRGPIAVPTAAQSPSLSLAEVGTAVARAEKLIAGPVVLSRLNPDIQVRFSREVLAAALRSEVVGSFEDPQIELFFAAEPLVEFLEPQRADIEFAPVDAQMVIRPDDVPTIIPSRTGLLIDEGALPAAVQAAAAAGSRSGVFPYREGALPEFSTEDAEALGIKRLLYTATTFYTPGGDEKNQNRIHNIHLIADMVNGAIVMPGETFSLNEHVGQRTEAKGFKRAGAIIGPIIDCCDNPANWGGGVSQFTTTIYNAVFFSGLEDVEHTPHTLYISRYPEGREATLGWPDPDLQFRNNTDAAVYIKCEHTDDSITVKFFGDNGGIHIAAELSERRSYTEPFDYYDPDPSVAPGEQDVTTEGTPGWTVTVYRIITYPDGTETTESWMWRYHPWPRRIAVNPCELPEDHPEYDPNVTCPSVVPDVRGMTLSGATQALGALNLVLVLGDPYEVTDPAQVGLVVAQSPASGTLLEADETVTVRIGVLTAGDT